MFGGPVLSCNGTWLCEFAGKTWNGTWLCELAGLETCEDEEDLEAPLLGVIDLLGAAFAFGSGLALGTEFNSPGLTNGLLLGCIWNLLFGGEGGVGGLVFCQPNVS